VHARERYTPIILEDVDRAGVTESRGGQEGDGEDDEDLEAGEDLEDDEDLVEFEDCEDQAFIEAATQLEDTPSTTATNENTNEQSARQVHERVVKERLNSLPATLRRLCECNDIAKEKSGQHPSSRQRKMGRRLKKVASNILALYRHETWTCKYVVSPITRVVLGDVMKSSQTRADFIQLCEVYAYEVYAHEVHAREMHVYEIHTHEMHACEVHAHEVHRRV
jgi:hypothetical protein